MGERIATANRICEAAEKILQELNGMESTEALASLTMATSHVLLAVAGTKEGAMSGLKPTMAAIKAGIRDLNELEFQRLQ